jgi:hypothetical protein
MPVRCSFVHCPPWLIALPVERTVVKASLKGLSENDPDTVTAMENLIPPFSSGGRWLEAEELQIENIGASSKRLDAGHLNMLAAMEYLARSHSESFNIASVATNLCERHDPDVARKASPRPYQIGLDATVQLRPDSELTFSTFTRLNVNFRGAAYNSRITSVAWGSL